MQDHRIGDISTVEQEELSIRHVNDNFQVGSTKISIVITKDGPVQVNHRDVINMPITSTNI